MNGIYQSSEKKLESLLVFGTANTKFFFTKRLKHKNSVNMFILALYNIIPLG